MTQKKVWGFPNVIAFPDWTRGAHLVICPVEIWPFQNLQEDQETSLAHKSIHRLTSLNTELVRFHDNFISILYVRKLTPGGWATQLQVPQPVKCSGQTELKQWSPVPTVPLQSCTVSEGGLAAVSKKGHCFLSGLHSRLTVKHPVITMSE